MDKKNNVKKSGALAIFLRAFFGSKLKALFNLWKNPQNEGRATSNEV